MQTQGTVPSISWVIKEWVHDYSFLPEQGGRLQGLIQLWSLANYKFGHVCFLLRKYPLIFQFAIIQASSQTFKTCHSVSWLIISIDFTYQWSGPLSCIKAPMYFHGLVWDEAREFAYLTNSWGMLVLLVQRPYFGSHWVKRMIQVGVTSSTLQLQSRLLAVRGLACQLPRVGGV